MAFAEVAVHTDVPYRQAFSYAVPPGMGRRLAVLDRGHPARAAHPARPKLRRPRSARWRPARPPAIIHGP